MNIVSFLKKRKKIKIKLRALRFFTQSDLQYTQKSYIIINTTNFKKF